MRILIISTNRNAHPMPVMPIGPCIVAEAAEAAGHGVMFLDLMFEHDPVWAVRSAIAGFRPDVVGISIRNIDNNDMMNPAFYIAEAMPIVQAVRQTINAPIVLGGAALSVMPEEIMMSLDVPIGVIGDGESVFPSLLDALSSGKDITGLPGVAYRKNGVISKNPCPRNGYRTDIIAPSYQRWLNTSAYAAHMATAPIQSKLGCAFRCIYCTYRKIEGGSYRLYDPGHVAETVERLSASGLRDIEFVDSVFNTPYEHAMSVCESIIRTRHRARLQSLELNPANFDAKLVTAMKRAGFVGIGMTVESASDRMLSNLRKGFTSRDVYRARDVLRKTGLPCVWIFLLGGPGETKETVEETLRFAESLDSSKDAVFINIGIRVYPGTELESIARAEGKLALSQSEMLRPVFYLSPNLDPDRLVEKVHTSMSRHMHFIDAGSLGFRHLPMIHRVMHRLGVRPPLWRYTRYIRRGLRMTGMEV